MGGWPKVPDLRGLKNAVREVWRARYERCTRGACRQPVYTASKKRNRTVNSIANISCTVDNRTVIVCRVRLPRQIFTANRVIILFRIFRTVLAVRKDERNQLSGKLIRTNPERRRLLRASVSWSPNYRTTPERLSRAPTRWRPSYAHSRHE